MRKHWTELKEGNTSLDISIKQKQIQIILLFNLNKNQTNKKSIEFGITCNMKFNFVSSNWLVVSKHNRPFLWKLCCRQDVGCNHLCDDTLTAILRHQTNYCSSSLIEWNTTKKFLHQQIIVEKILCLGNANGFSNLTPT